MTLLLLITVPVTTPRFSGRGVSLPVGGCKLRVLGGMGRAAAQDLRFKANGFLGLFHACRNLFGFWDVKTRETAAEPFRALTMIAILGIAETQQ